MWRGWVTALHRISTYPRRLACFGEPEPNDARIGFSIPIPIKRAFIVCSNDWRLLRHWSLQNTMAPGPSLRPEEPAKPFVEELSEHAIFLGKPARFCAREDFRI